MKTILHVSVVALLAAGCTVQPSSNRLSGGTDDPTAGFNGGGGGEGSTGGSGGGGSTGGGGTPTPAPQAQASLAKGLVISEIAVLQGVKVSVAKAGAKVAPATRKMPVVARREGLVRVYVTPDAGWTPHAVTAELHLVGATPFPVLKDTKTISAPSTDGAATSTFNFDVPGASLPAGAKYFVQLVDAAAPPVATSVKNPAQHPMDGTVETLDAIAGSDKLKITLVPVQYNADGSGRVPSTSPAVLDALKKKTLELYPVPDVELTVHAPIPFAGVISADGTQGWDAVVTDIAQLRAQEAAPADVYYYGVFAPAASFAAYCPQSCVLGLASGIPAATDATQRAAAGALFGDALTIGTLPHELGHTHGRSHAPCGGAAGADPAYPYAGGKIGTWGYSIVTKTLFDPATYVDQMSYCHPEWQSDYSFNALFVRGKLVSNANIVSGDDAPGQGVPQSYRFATVHADGSLTWHASSPVRMNHLDGHRRPVHFDAPDGSEMSAGMAFFYPFDHIEGGFLVVPEGPVGFHKARFDEMGPKFRHEMPAPSPRP
jgi:Peptidase M66